MTSLLIDPARAMQDSRSRLLRMYKFLFELCDMNKLPMVYIQG
jgi:hypothetical protein